MSVAGCRVSKRVLVFLREVGYVRGGGGRLCPWGRVCPEGRVCPWCMWCTYPHPHRQNDWWTPIKIITFPKLPLRAVTRLYIFKNSIRISSLGFMLGPLIIFHNLLTLTPTLTYKNCLVKSTWGLQWNFRPDQPNKEQDITQDDLWFQFKTNMVEIDSLMWVHLFLSCFVHFSEAQPDFHEHEHYDSFQNKCLVLSKAKAELKKREMLPT